MTKYEMLQHLLNTLIFKELITKYLHCDKINVILSEYEKDQYLLDVEVIDVLNDQEVKMYTESFEIELDYRGSVRSFFIRFSDKVTVNSAFESADLGEKIEDFLKSRLN